MSKLIVRHRGIIEYSQALSEMQAFIGTRSQDTSDEIWLLQHPPVFTQGQAGKAEHILQSVDIPIVQSDRGGQVTYHGPGQLVAYILFDLKRLKFTIRQLVNGLEQSIIDLLHDYSITANRKENAPGVYVDGAKVCSVGLRIKHSYSYHGLALNIDMDLSPFDDINTCGYPDLNVTQLRTLGVNDDIATISAHLICHIAHNIGYNEPIQILESVDDEHATV